MKVWRIATETKKYLATDLSGKGAAISPGRWNHSDLPVLYTASTASLAMLETVAHIDSNDLPELKFLISIDINEAQWEKREILKPSDLPKEWDNIPHSDCTADYGSNWISEGRSLVLCVPSAITPEETVVLINPLHQKAKTLKAKKIRIVDYKTVFR